MLVLTLERDIVNIQCLSAGTRRTGVEAADLCYRLIFAPASCPRCEHSEDTRNRFRSDMHQRFFAEQYPKALGPTVSELKEVLPAEQLYVDKTRFSMCGAFATVQPPICKMFTCCTRDICSTALTQSMP